MTPLYKRSYCVFLMPRCSIESVAYGFNIRVNLPSETLLCKHDYVSTYLQVECFIL